MRSLFLILALSFATATFSDDRAQVNDDMLAAADVFGDCAGMYQHIGNSLKAMDQPALGESMLEEANGALIAGAYLLYLYDNGERPLRQFLPYTQGRADVKLTQLAAAEEAGDLDVKREQMTICNMAADFQKRLVQQVRRATYVD